MSDFLILPQVTVTGADIDTDISLIDGDFELGVLYRDTVDYVSSVKYRTKKEVLQFLKKIRATQPYRRVALHVCGYAAQIQLGVGELDELLFYCHRIQINGKVTPSYVGYISLKYPNHKLITQYYEDNRSMSSERIKNHSHLIDASHGNGIYPDEWVIPEFLQDRVENKDVVGFAGGLSEHNIGEFLNSVEVLGFHRGIYGDDSEPVWWLDLETSLRNEKNEFCTDRVEAFAKNFYKEIGWW